MEDTDAMAPAGAFRHQLIHEAERLNGRIAFFLDVGARNSRPGHNRRADQRRYRNTEPAAILCRRLPCGVTQISMPFVDIAGHLPDASRRRLS